MTSWPVWGLIANAAALLIASIGLWRASWRDARLVGGDRQRLKRLEDERAGLATAESVGAIAGRVAELEGEVKQAAAAMTEVMVIKTKLDGLDRLVTSQLDEIKTTLRRLEERSFAAQKSARRGQTVG